MIALDSRAVRPPHAAATVFKALTEIQNFCRLRFGRVARLDAGDNAPGETTIRLFREALVRANTFASGFEFPDLWQINCLRIKS